MPREKKIKIRLFLNFFFRFFLFSIFFFEKLLSKILEILDFFAVFLFAMVSIGKVSFSAKCLFGRIGGLKIF